jgi:hypothetical protein
MKLIFFYLHLWNVLLNFDGNNNSDRKYLSLNDAMIVRLMAFDSERKRDIKKKA